MASEGAKVTPWNRYPWPMRILTFNANGLRSAASKGFFDWFAARDVDVLCLQETKAQEHQLSDAVFRPAGYKAWFKDASTKKGYSGVAIYSRREPDEVRTALGWAPFDDEGRYIEARFGESMRGVFNRPRFALFGHDVAKFVGTDSDADPFDFTCERGDDLC